MCGKRKLILLNLTLIRFGSFILICTWVLILLGLPLKKCKGVYLGFQTFKEVSVTNGSPISCFHHTMYTNIPDISVAGTSTSSYMFNRGWGSDPVECSLHHVHPSCFHPLLIGLGFIALLKKRSQVWGRKTHLEGRGKNVKQGDTLGHVTRMYPLNVQMKHATCMLNTHTLTRSPTHRIIST